MKKSDLQKLEVAARRNRLMAVAESLNNRDAMARAIVDAANETNIADTGNPLSSYEREAYFQDLRSKYSSADQMRSPDFNWSPPKVTAPEVDVQEPATTDTTVEAPSGGLSAFISNAVNSRRLNSLQAEQNTDRMALRGQQIPSSITDRAIDSIANTVSSILPVLPIKSAATAAKAVLSRSPAEIEKDVALRDSEIKIAQAKKAAAEDMLNPLAKWTSGKAIPALTDANNAVGLGAALAGGAVAGPAGAVVGATAGAAPAVQDAYNQAYIEAIDNYDANDDEAREYADSIANISAVSNVAGNILPLAGGKIATNVASRLGAQRVIGKAAGLLQQRIATRTGGFVAGTAGNVIPSVAEKDLTERVKEGYSNDLDFGTGEGRQRLATETGQYAANRLEELLDTAALAAVSSAPFTAGVEMYRHGAEVSRRTKDTADQAEKVLKEERAKAQANIDSANGVRDSAINEQLRQEFERVNRQSDEDAAYAENDAANSYDEQQKADEIEAGFRTMEANRASPSSRVERYGTSDLPEEVGTGNQIVERVPVEPTEVTPEFIAQEREANAQAEAERADRAELGGIAEEIRKRKQKAADAADKDAKKKERESLAEKRKRRNAIIDELLKENPNLTEAELAPLVRERMNQEPASSTPTVAANAPAKPSDVVPTTPSADVPATTNVDDMAKAMGLDTLGMADKDKLSLNKNKPKAEEADTSIPDEVPSLPSLDTPDYRKKLSGIMKALNKKNTNPTVDVQNLVRQGKLVIAPNEASVGRKARGNAAEYDPASNRMYLYLDKLGNKPTVKTLMGALHESGHFAQFNERVGRGKDKALSVLVDKGYLDSARSKIVSAAKNGNKLAQKVLKEVNDNVTDASHAPYETAAYLIHNVTEARNSSTLGAVRGAVSDLVAGTRKLLRDTLGADIDVSFNDLASATQRVGREAVNTEPTSTNASSSDTLGMIYTRKPEDARERGDITYTSTDGRVKYVRSDDKARFTTTGIANLKKGNTVRLGDLIKHDVLFDEAPEIADTPVTMAGAYMPKGADGLYKGGEIFLNDTLANNLTDGRRSALNVLLHEVQHALQDANGYSNEFYDGKKFTTANRRLEVSKAAVDMSAEAFMSNEAELVDLMDRPTRNRYEEWKSNHPNASDTSRAMAIGEMLDEAGIDTLPNDLEFYRDDLQKTVYDYYKHRRAFDKVADDYFSNITENEAFLTQDDRQLSQEEINARGNPEDFMRTRDRSGNTAVDNRIRGRLDVPNTTLGMAAHSVGMSEGNFRRWFDNSTLVNEDGSPRQMYHGTRASEDFDEFKIGPGEIGIHIGTKEQASDPAFVGRIYSTDPNVQGITQRVHDSIGAKPRVFPLYARLTKPLRIINDQFGNSPEAILDSIVESLPTDEANKLPTDMSSRVRQLMKSSKDWEVAYPKAFAYIRNELNKLGYDGLVYENTAEGKYVQQGDKLPSYPYGSDVNQDSYVVFDPSQIKSVNNSGEWSNSTNNILGMAQKAERDINNHTMPVWFTSLFQNSIGVGKRGFLGTHTSESRGILAAIEHSKSSPAGARAAAQGAQGRYEIALSRLANERGITYDKLNKQVESTLSALPKDINGHAANRAAFDAAVAKFGAAGDALIELRDIADQLSLSIIKDRYDLVKDGYPLTDAEKAELQTIYNNLGRYTHRQYAANIGKAGKSYAERIWKDYSKNKNTEAAAKVANAVNYLIDNNFMIPDDSGLANAKADTVRSLYKTWINKGLTDLDQMRQELSATRDSVNGNKELLKNRAEQSFKELIGLSSSGTDTVANYYRGSLLDRTILNKRKSVPAELRAAMGEITDPSMSLLLTASKQADFVARNRLLNEARNFNGEVLPPDTRQSKPNNWVTLSGETWGGMNGWHVSPNLHALLSDTIEQLATLDQAAAMAAKGKPDTLLKKAVSSAIDKYGYLAGMSKYMSIVWNAANTPMNIVGSFIMGVNNGNFGGGISAPTYREGAGAAAQLIAHAANPKYPLTGLAKDALEYGVTDSATVGELGRTQNKQLALLIKQMSGKDVNATGRKLLRGLSAIRDTTTEAYAMADVWMKMANFQHQIDLLTRYYDAAGIKKTPEEIKRAAADVTNLTNITYKKAAPIVKSFEKAGLTRFGPYMYEVWRSQIANVGQAFAELQMAKNAPTPEASRIMAMQGAKRLIGQLGMWGMLSAGSVLSAQALGDDDAVEALRNALPDFIKDQDFVPLGRTEDGRAVLWNWSRMDSVGPITDVMRTAVNIKDANLDDLKDKVLSLYVAPAIAPRILDVVNSFGDGRDAIPRGKPLIQQLFPSAYGNALDIANTLGVPDKTAVAFTRLLESVFTPGQLNALKETNPIIDPSKESDPTLKTVAQLARVMQYAGVQMYTYDAPRNASFVGKAYKEDLAGYRKQLTYFMNNRPDASRDDIRSELANLAGKEMEHFKKARDQYKAMLATGSSKEEARKALTNAGLSNDIVNEVARNKFRSHIADDNVIKGFLSNDLKNAKTLADKREVRAKWKERSKMLKEVGISEGDLQ